MSKPKIILASVSIGRKQLLEKLGVDFEVLPSTIDEDRIIHTNPIKMLQMRSQEKAENVVRQIIQLSNNQINTNNPINKRNIHKSLFVNHKSVLVIAADSMAVLNGKTYGKAKTKAEGKQILEELMGKTHEFVTATSIVYLNSYFQPNEESCLQNYAKEDPCLSRQASSSPQDDKKGLNNVTIKQFNNVTTTLVTMRKFSEKELDDYVKYFDFTRFAAAYALNEYPTDLVTKIEGSYTNVIGLPFEVILPIFREFKII
jgi:septum formation protein